MTVAVVSETKLTTADMDMCFIPIKFLDYYRMCLLFWKLRRYNRCIPRLDRECSCSSCMLVLGRITHGAFDLPTQQITLIKALAVPYQ